MKKIIFLLLIILLITPAFAEEPLPLTIDSSVQNALLNNKTFDNVKKSIQKAELNYRSTAKDALPNVLTRYSYMRFQKELDISYPDLGLTLPIMDQDNYMWSTKLTVPLYTGGEQQMTEQIAKLGINTAKLNLFQAKNQMIASVKYYYFNALREEKFVEFLSQNVKNCAEHRSLSEKFYKEGLVAKNSVLEAKTEEANASLQLENSLRNVEVALSSLKTTMGMDINKPISLKDALDKKYFGKTLEECMEYAQKNNPELVAFSYSKKQAEYAIRIDQAHYIPKIDMSADYLKYGTHPNLTGYDYLPNNILYGMLNFTWSFWDWGKKSDEAKIKKLQLEQVINTEKTTRDNTMLKIKEAYTQLKTSDKNIDVACLAVDCAKENLRIVKLQYAQQITPSYEVINAITKLANAQYNYYNSLYLYNIAVAQLENLMGIDMEKIVSTNDQMPNNKQTPNTKN